MGVPRTGTLRSICLEKRSDQDINVQPLVNHEVKKREGLRLALERPFIERILAEIALNKYELLRIIKIFTRNYRLTAVTARPASF